ncbi:glycosyl hydrolase family 28-related protein [Paenibacillus sp. Soil724D2]|uniref:glycosyl hydrolase family 28-related protein n=1 Tax=Paenibacillus sp. (strain Soil724D2) TaxID=1736392 RepID=UPI000713E99F|nr:glycosyl hydrolase family 28-related protein [Paenibacillus sp. Soil724D2]KRE33294.1 hypothetical protein ASG85_13520 [Paenibacillus sp. Soil724D2]
MSDASELIAQQILNGSINKKNWGQVLYNVKVFGAKGDGVYDDTQAVQDAIDTAISNNATLVYFPPGSYKVTSLANTSTINFVGDNAVFVGYGGTIVQWGDMPTQLVINVKDNGVLGDGVTDDTTAIQTAVDIVNNGGGGIVYFPKGTYKITSPIRVFGNNIQIKGAGIGATVIKNYGTTDALNLNDSWLKVQITICDLTIDANTQTTGRAINCINVHRSIIDRVQIKKHKYGIYFGVSCFDIYCSKLNVIDVSQDGSAFQIDAGDLGGGIWITDVTVDCGAATGTYGLDLLSGGGNFFTNIDFRTAKNDGIIIRPTTGQTVMWSWFTNVLGDTCTGNGIHLNPSGSGVINSASFVNCWGSTNGSNGFVVGSTGTIDGIELIGLRCLDNQFEGLLINGGINVEVNGGTFAGNSKNSSGSNNGIKVGANVNKFKIRNVRSGQSSGRTNTQAYGVTVLPTANNYMIVNCDFTLNISGGLNDAGGGANKVVANNLS